MSRTPALRALLALAALALPLRAQAQASDTDLFRTNVPPNVLLIVDNSKSMTNTVWHPDYGKTNPVGQPTNAGGSLEWSDQDDCTHFRDTFASGGVGTQKFRVYPGGRKVNYQDSTGFVVRSRGDNVKAWELAHPVMDAFGTHLWNDKVADGVRDTGNPDEWLAYYRICDPADDSDYVDKCEAIDDYDGDGNPGVYVHDAAGSVILSSTTETRSGHPNEGSPRPLIYRWDPDDTAGMGLGNGKSVKRLTYISNPHVALAAGLDPITYTFTSGDICGVDPTGWSLFIGELSAETPNGFTVQYTAKYLDFLFSKYAGGAFGAARDAVFAPTVGNDGVRSKSPCISLEPAEPSTYDTYRRTRLMALRLVLRTVTCELEEDVRFGIMQFRFHGKPGDDNGGYVVLPIQPLVDDNGDPTEYTLHGIHDTHEAHMSRVISRVGPDAQTPLSETLFQAYTYFMSRDPDDLPPGRDYLGAEVSGVSFPTYTYNMDMHNPLPDDGGDLNMVGGHYVCGPPRGSSDDACTGLGNTTTHPRPVAASSLDADGLDPNGDGGEAPFPAWDKDVAPDPVEYACQKNFVILITDGGSHGDRFDDVDDVVNSAFEPPADIETSTDRGYSDFFTLIGDHYRNADGSPDEVELPADSKVSRYMDDIAYFMNQWDFRPDLDGDQTIDTYTVGYSVDDVEVSNVEKAAIRGNGLFFESADADELAADIVAAFTDIIAKSQSFTSATVPASRTTDGNNFYASYFRPKEETPYWDGHLKNFDFTKSGDILTAPDAGETVGRCAIGTQTSLQPPDCPNSGQLRTSDVPFWDAADEMPDPDDRKLYYGDGDTAFGDQPPPWSHPTLGGTILPEDLGLPDDPADLDAGTAARLQGEPYNLPLLITEDDLEDVAEALQSNLSGCDYGTLLGSDCALRTNEDGSRSILGDIFHSNPVVVGSPNAPINESVYQAFAYEHRQRDRVIYAGSNDGWLHGWNAGVFREFESDGITPLAPPRHDRGTGVELFGFMPADVRYDIWLLPSSQLGGGARTTTTVDGSPVVSDAWIYRQVELDDSLGSLLSPPLSTTKAKEQWRTVLLSGLRDGGQSYFALDITDPASSSYPGYLWEFPCDDCASAINGATDAERDWMGFTWSEAVVARVRVAVEGDASPGGHERWVVIVGAGYHEYGDPNHVSYVADADPDPAYDPDTGFVHRHQGRAIYMIDITTGQVLARKRYDAAAAVGDPEGAMKYAFPSQPAVYDLDFDGFADVIYIGDLGGNVFKWVVTSVGDDPINNSGSDNDVDQPDWPFKLFFQADHSGVPDPPAYGADHFQSFFFPPTAVLKYGKLTLAFGAGERAAPEAGALDSDDGNNNHFFVVKDIDPLEKAASPLASLDEADLVSTATLNSGSLTCEEVANETGYILTGEDTEKFITNPVVFLGDVFAGSFLPAPPGADLCTASGTSFLYRFSLECGEGAFQSNPGDADDKRRKAVGSGIPTRPRVSVGGLNSGGDDQDPCDNRMIMITSDGQIEDGCTEELGGTGVNVRSWRER